MPDPTFDLGTSVGTALTSGGASGILVWLFIKSKLDSISLLWRKFDELRQGVQEQRVADAKEYATRAEVKEAITRLETHIDKRMDMLEEKLKK